MEEELNVTYITFGGHVELHKYRYLYFMVVFTVYILIFCSNSTIVYLIWNHQNLHEPMYIFIAALLSLDSCLASSILILVSNIRLGRKAGICHSRLALVPGLSLN
uniref:G-protein coupled receptors family 1 profile domain-containing protein n=1 Tax=Monopterus albus TaxID=43700 RepID=A0A3Q3IUU3_MONAL